MPLPDNFNLPDEYPIGFDTNPIPGANEPMRQERSYSEIVNTSLYDLLGDLGLTADSSINKYFTPYDPTIEESVKRIGELQGEQQRQSISSNLESVRNVMGQTGLASSFTQNLAEISGLDMGRLELQDIRKSVGREIFKQQKKFAEDFYDTVLDLAQLEVFNQPETIIPEDDEGFVDIGSGEDITEQDIALACENSGGFYNYETGVCETAPEGCVTGIEPECFE